MHDDVEIAHHDERNLNFVLDASQLFEKMRQRLAVLKRHRSGTLNDRTVGQWVAERDAHLYHINSTTFEGLNHIGCTLQSGAACTEIEREQLATRFTLLGE